MRIVEDNIDPPYYYEAKDYGYQVPEGLWAEYEKASEELDRLAGQISCCPYKRPPPPTDPLLRMMEENYTRQMTDNLATYVEYRGKS